MATGLWTDSSISSANSSKEDEENWLTGELTRIVEASTVNGKHDFLRFMGLQVNNCRDINCNSNKINKNINNNNNNNNNQTNNNNNNNNNNNDDLYACCKRPCRSSSGTSEIIGDDENLRNSRTRVMVGWHEIIPSLRECSVTIIGEKCKICGRSFKCIRDVQIHEKKKHRRRKPRKEIVLRIGDEVISRVSIKRKHLKRIRKDKDETIDTSHDATSLWNVKEVGFDRLTDKERDPCVNDGCGWNRDEAGSRLMDIEEKDISRECLDNTPRLELGHLDKDDEEEIQVVLKITRPRKTMEINLEPPSRIKRQRLITDEFREFIRIDDDFVEVIEPPRDLQVYREDDDIIEEYCRVNNGSCNLDIEERNCSFHIENEDSIDSYVDQVNSLLPETNDACYDDDEVSIRSEHYRDENGDIIPDFIDYTHCLKNRTSHRNNNNDNVYDMDSLFYNECRINEWKKTARDLKPVGFDICQNTSGRLESSVLIKEEIMLDDLL